MTLQAAPPLAPTGLEASNGSFATQVHLTWDHMPGATIYRIFRGDSEDFSSAFSIGVTESIAFAETTGANEQHFYWVRAESPEGISELAGPVRGGTGGSAIFSPLVVLLNPPPTANPLTGAKIYLGKTLFWDEQLSSTRTTACGTCHRFRAGGTDPRAIPGDPATTHPGPDGIRGNDDDVTGSRGVPLSGPDGLYRWSNLFGIQEQVTKRRAQNIFDVLLGPQGLLWDGRAAPVFNDPETGQRLLTVNAAAESQALLPFLDTTEMGHEGRTLTDLIARLRESRPLALAAALPPALARWIGERSYEQLFEDAYGVPGITPARIAMAIASYVRTLQPDRMSSTTLNPIVHPGFRAFLDNTCSACHGLPFLTNGSFQATGVRPAEEDPGRGAVVNSNLNGVFRTPGLRGVGLRPALQHNGRFANLREIVEFYNRGGDFPNPNINTNFVRPREMTEQQKRDLEAFMRYTMTDTRMANESGPIFDRPMLYSESARRPAIEGTGAASSNGTVPEAIAIEPPFAGNPSFTVGLTGVPPGANAVLVIGAADPGTDAIPAEGSFARREVVTSTGASGQGFASVSLTIPADAALIGKTLFGRWYVAGGVSRLIRFTIFSTERSTAPVLLSLPAASLTKGLVAPLSLVSGFGEDLAGTTLRITDRTGASFTPTILFSSATQINYLAPAGLAPGEATIQALRGGTVVAEGTLGIAPVAPGLFAANADGRDAAAALTQRVAPGGTQTIGNTSRFDAALGRLAPETIDLGPDGSQTFLVLFGTGIRGGSDVKAAIGGEDAPVVFFGAQGEFEGLDQVNVRVPATMAGRGEVDLILTVDGIRANPLRVAFQ